MNIQKGTLIKTKKEIEIPIMPPVLFGHLKENTTYKVSEMKNNDEVTLHEVTEEAFQNVSIKISQIEDETNQGHIQILN